MTTLQNRIIRYDIGMKVAAPPECLPLDVRLTKDKILDKSIPSLKLRSVGAIRSLPLS